MAISKIIISFLSQFQSFIEFMLDIPLLGWIIDVYLSISASFLTLFSGGIVANNIIHCNRPKKTLILYQFEGCPFCRKVRETLSVLALDVIINPCPRTSLKEYGISESSRYRGEAVTLSGKCMFPFLIDPNFNPPLRILESTDIIRHLWTHYGNQATLPINSKIANLFNIHYFLPSLLRPLPRMGICRIPAHKPKRKLELWSYEANPFARLVREVLDSFEISYYLYNIPIGCTYKRDLYISEYYDYISTLNHKLGFIEIPLLYDPNNNLILCNHIIIIDYLYKTYAYNGRKTKINVKWNDYTTKGATSQHGTM
jgi:glutaredoxin